MNELNATLTIQEWDYIGNILKQRPWVEVDGLIAKLNNQFAHQTTSPAAPIPNAPLAPAANIVAGLAQQALSSMESVLPVNRGPATSAELPE